MPSADPWDLFCRVVDNFGDIGVCWRLARELERRGQPVRLWTDDRSALSWMAPQGAPGVAVLDWQDCSDAVAPGPVVIEAFGCDLPEPMIAAMARQDAAPLWIDLEYLSAEPYVERSHGLPSPQWSGPARGLTRWFFYPGFTTGTGGLLRERDLATRQAAFDPAGWLHARGWSTRPGERLVTLFCYESPALPALLQALAREPTLLLLTPGPAQRQVQALGLPPGLRGVTLPWLTQEDFDHLLWSADLNLVRGEDSCVRAAWAAKPFLWQLYPQDDGAHGAKLQAFLDCLCEGQEAALSRPLRNCFAAWNSLPGSLQAWPEEDAWRRASLGWRNRLLAQDDLVTQLMRFVRDKRLESEALRHATDRRVNPAREAASVQHPAQVPAGPQKR